MADAAPEALSTRNFAAAFGKSAEVGSTRE